MVSVRARAMRFLIRSGIRPVRALPLEQRRARIERLSARARLPKSAMISPLREQGVCGEWVRMPRSREDRTILYLHGGAFCMGSPASHRNLVAHICACGEARALSLDYRLAPEHPFPAALEDTVEAYRYLRRSGVAAERIAIIGDSAGANLALAALINLRDAVDPLPAAAVCISPPTDLTGGSESLQTRARLDPMLRLETVVPFLRAYVGGSLPRDPLISPLWADLHGMPPLLIHVGSHEILHDDAVRFAEKAKEAGVDVRLEVWDQLWHVWHASVPHVPEAREAIRCIGRFLRDHIPD